MDHSIVQLSIDLIPAVTALESSPLPTPITKKKYILN
jgi:hypothetical protein